MKESRVITLEVMTEGDLELNPVPGRLPSTILLCSEASPAKKPL